MKAHNLLIAAIGILLWFASPAAAGNSGCSALHDAVFAGDTNRSENLLRQGVNVNCRDADLE